MKLFRKWDTTNKIGRFNGRINLNFKEGKINWSQSGVEPEEMIISDAASVSKCMQRVDEWAVETNNIAQWDRIQEKFLHFVQFWSKVIEATNKI
jgi:hypothetical protein